MFVACVYVHVRPEFRDQFIAATIDNARNSIEEPGCLRFDVTQDAENSDYFMLYEVYRDEAAAADHKRTAHYLRWRDTVADWMAEPRRAVIRRGLFPAVASQWEARG